MVVLNKVMLSTANVFIMSISHFSLGWQTRSLSLSFSLSLSHIPFAFLEIKIFQELFICHLEALSGRLFRNAFFLQRSFCYLH